MRGRDATRDTIGGRGNRIGSYPVDPFRHASGCSQRTRHGARSCNAAAINVAMHLEVNCIAHNGKQYRLVDNSSRGADLDAAKELSDVVGMHTDAPVRLSAEDARRGVGRAPDAGGDDSEPEFGLGTLRL